MEKSKPKEMTAKQRKQFRLAMYSCGVASIVLGAFFAFVVPEILGEDPEIYRILGGLTVLLSFPEFGLVTAMGACPKTRRAPTRFSR